MNQPPDIFYVSNILDSVGRIIEYVEGLDRDAFFKTPMAQDAVIRQLQVIGEATKRLTDEFRHAHPEIPWKNMTGMRDKLIHDYLGIDIDAVWKTATVYVPEVKRGIEELLRRGPGPNIA